MKGKWKQKGKKKKGNAVLQKYMMSVDEFVKNKSGAEEADGGHGLRFVKKKSRKELRKEKRKLKKAKMKCHYEGKKDLPLQPTDGEKSEKIPPVQKDSNKTKKEASTSANAAAKSEKSKTPSSKKGKIVTKLQETRKKALMEANEQEDKEIKKLERYLGFNKRKNKKSLPQSFVTDGLDYILGVLDSGPSAEAMFHGGGDDDYDMDTAKDNFEKLDNSDFEKSDGDEEAGDEMESKASDDGDEEELDDDDDGGDDEEDDDNDKEEAEEEMDDNETDDSDAADSDEESEEEMEETADIYGRMTPSPKSEAVSLHIYKNSSLMH